MALNLILYVVLLHENCIISNKVGIYYW